MAPDNKPHRVAVFVEGAVAFAEGIFVDVPYLLILQHMILLLLLGGGIALILGRWALLWSAPFLAAQSWLVADIINAVILFCRLMWLAFAEVEDLLSDIIDGLNSLGLGVGHLPKLDAKFDYTAEVSSAEVHEVLMTVINVCAPYDNAWKIVYHAVKLMTHDAACSTVRYVYPVNWLRVPLEAVLSPFYDGSANPVSTHDAPGNCENSLKDPLATSSICLGVGSGYLVLEILLPFMLIVLLCMGLGKGLFMLFKGIWSLLKEVAATRWEEFKAFTKRHKE